MPGLLEHTIRTLQGAVRIGETRGDETRVPLLLIHGTGASRHAFRYQLESPLALSRRMIALDLLGHGDSEDAAAPEEAYALRGFAGTIREVCAALGVSRVAIFGWSLGGHVGLELLGSTPELLAGLMVTGAPPVPLGPWGMLQGFALSRDALLAGKQRFSESDVRRLAALCYHGSETPECLAWIRRADWRVRSYFPRSMLLGHGANERAAALSAKVPVLLANGEHDPFVRARFIEGLTGAGFPKEQYHVFGGAGHAPFWETPAAFNAVLARFLRSIDTVY